MAFLNFFLRRTLVVNVILFAVFGLAYASLQSTNSNEFPEVDLSTMIITTLYPGASPKDVEQNVTRLIEDELKGVTGLDNFKSVSAENVSSITVEIDVDEPNQEAIKDEVRRAVERVAELPDEVDGRPRVRDLKSTEIPVLVVGISSAKASGDDVKAYGELRDVAKIIERDIKRIRGVSAIDKYGFRDREFQVLLDPAKLNSESIALNDILFALEKRNVRASGGALESFRTQRNILTLSQFESKKDIANVIVRANFLGNASRIKDIGTVQDGFEDEQMRPSINGERGILLVIKKSATQDIIEVVDSIKDYLATKQDNLDEHISLTAANDASFPVRNRINVVLSNAVIGFALVVVILIIFLDLNSSFLIALSIPTSFAITLIIMNLVGVDINVITLLAMIIALGMIVDQSIVISENSIVHLGNSFGGGSAASPQAQGLEEQTASTILKGTMEVVLPVVASVVTTILAFVPMFAMSGIIGKFIGGIPIVIIAALTGSLINCFLILPNHLSHTLRKKARNLAERLGLSSSSAQQAQPTQPTQLANPSGQASQSNTRTWQDRLFDRIAVPYQKTLPYALRFRYVTGAVATLLLVFSLWFAGKNIQLNMFPPDGADTFFIFLELDDSATFNATGEKINEIEKYVREIPADEIQYFTAKIGTNNANELAAPVGGEQNLAYIQVTLTAFTDRNRDAEVIMQELRKKVEDNVKDVREIRFELEKPGPPAGTPIELRVHSDNDKLRKQFVREIVNDLKNYEGVYGVSSTDKLGREEYKLNINYSALAESNLTVQDVAGTLRIAFDGVDATSIVQNNEEVTIRARFPLKYRRDITNVLNLKVRNSTGQLVPVKSFGKLTKIRAETAIRHTDGDVTTTITGQTEFGVAPQEVIKEVLGKYELKAKDYPEVTFSYGGEAEETSDSVASLIAAFLGGVISIYLVLTLLFNSLPQPAIVLAAIPFGIIGVIWAFYIHGRPFSFMGLIGIVGLSGIVVNNSLMMVEFINKLVNDAQARAKQAGRTARLRASELIEDVTAGATRRLRPIIITTITTVTGLLPTAYGVGGSDPFIEPMVLAIAWGLVFSTQISLFLIPAFYLSVVDIENIIAGIFQRLGRGWSLATSLVGGLFQKFGKSSPSE